MRYLVLLVLVVTVGFGYLLIREVGKNKLLTTTNAELVVQKEALAKQVNILIDSLESSQESAKESAHAVDEMVSSIRLLPLIEIVKEQNVIQNKMTDELGKRGMKQEEFDKMFKPHFDKLKELSKIEEEKEDEDERHDTKDQVRQDGDGSRAKGNQDGG